MRVEGLGFFGLRTLALRFGIWGLGFRGLGFVV